MKLPRLRLPSKCGRFARDRRGVSAVEFALLAPLMIALYLGSVEVSDGVSADRKVTLAAAALANLTAQVTTISNSDMSNILNASSAIIAPYSPNNLTITVSCLSIDSKQKATVKWSASMNGNARAAGSVYTFAGSTSALDVANTQLILAEASYNYTPIVGDALTGMITLSDRMFMSPRITAPVYNNLACS
jgi:Flp pilus assembly protein TadG